MVARITKYKVRAAARDEAIEILNSLKKRIMSLQGMQQFINTMNPDGSGYVITLVRSAEDVEKNESDAQEIWSNFGQFLESEPMPEDFEVIANWTA